MNATITPTGVLIPRLKPGSAEWLQRMSASKIAAVVGLSPYQSRFSLWHRMAGLVEQEADNDEMRRGHYLEPGCAAWFADQHPDWDIDTTGTFVHHEREWQVASPDRVVTHPSGHVELLQCKTAADREHWGDAGTDDIPVGYRAQVIWEMDTTGLRTCHLAVLLPYLEFRDFVVHYDETEADYLRTQGRQFLDELAAGVRPAIDDHVATYDVVRELHPDIELAKVDVPDELAESYLAAIAQEKAAKAAKRLASALLIDHMDRAKEAYYQGRCIARRQAKGGGVPYLVAAKGANPTSLKEAAA